MSWVALRALLRTILIRLVGIAVFTGALGLGMSWLLDVVASEPEWTETAAIAQRAVDRSGLPELPTSSVSQPRCCFTSPVMPAGVSASSRTDASNSANSRS